MTPLRNICWKLKQQSHLINRQSNPNQHMNKVWLIIQREFLNRVQKKSYLLATILVPLIIPAIMGVLVFVMIKEAESAKADTVHVVDESGKFVFENNKHFTFVKLDLPLDKAKSTYQQTKDFGLLYIPQFDIQKPEGFTIFTKENPSIEKVGELEGIVAERIRDL